MELNTIECLNDLNRQFYATVADVFDQTRSHAWTGWERLLIHLQTLPVPLRVLDVGCGNGRFGLFLAQHGLTVHYTGYDNNQTLLDHAHTALTDAALASVTLTRRESLLHPLSEAPYDVIGVFGVLHHVPGQAQRLAFMRDLAAHVSLGGILAVAGWRFLEDDRLRERVVSWPPDLRERVEAHDYLLDWRQGAHALRYCHYVDDAEQQALEDATDLTLIERYRADGRSGQLNAYSVLRRLF